MTSISPTKADPAEGMTRVVSMPAVVVFPAPLGPSSPKISPEYTSRSRPSTALKSVPGYVFVKPRVRITAVGDLGAASDSSGAVVIKYQAPVIVGNPLEEIAQAVQLFMGEKRTELGIQPVGKTHRLA